MPTGGAPDRPRKSELPWNYNPRFALFGVCLVLAFVLALAVIEERIAKGARWYVVLGGFAFGAGIGLIGVRTMIRTHEACWPLTRFEREMTGGNFFALKMPTFTRAYWRIYRQVYRKQSKRDVLLPLLLWVGCICSGILAWKWLHIPGGGLLPAVAFFGCLLTTGALPNYLWVRSLPE